MVFTLETGSERRDIPDKAVARALRSLRTIPRATLDDSGTPTSCLLALVFALVDETFSNAREEFEYNIGVCWPAKCGCVNVQSSWIFHGLD